MQDRHHFPRWFWTLFALSLAFVLALARFAIGSGLELRIAGKRIAGVSQMQAMLMKVRTQYGWADYVADHYVHTGVGSPMQGDSLQDYATAVANVHSLVRALQQSTGQSTREAAVVRHFSSTSEANFALFQHCIDLRRVGNAKAAAQAYLRANADNRTAYTDLDLLAVLGARDEQVLAGSVSASGRHATRLAWAGGLLAVLLLSVYALLLLRDLSVRAELDGIKNEFISLVSHELRTPLTSIRGALGLLVSGKLGVLPGQGQRILQIASSNAERLVTLVNDILDFDRLQSGTLRMEPRDIDAGRIVVAAMESMLGLAMKSSVEMKSDAESFTLYADPDRLQQVLTNLLSNAIKFSPEGSTIWITARRVEDHAEFRIIDKGRGIPPSMLEKIFDRFQQVDGTDSRARGGTGLGLPICRSIVHQHNGRIWAESKLGQGSIFIIHLPLHPTL